MDKGDRFCSEKRKRQTWGNEQQKHNPSVRHLLNALNKDKPEKLGLTSFHVCHLRQRAPRFRLLFVFCFRLFVCFCLFVCLCFSLLHGCHLSQESRNTESFEDPATTKQNNDNQNEKGKRVQKAIQSLKLESRLRIGKEEWAARFQARITHHLVGCLFVTRPSGSTAPSKTQNIESFFQREWHQHLCLFWKKEKAVFSCNHSGDSTWISSWMANLFKSDEVAGLSRILSFCSFFYFFSKSSILFFFLLFLLFLLSLSLLSLFLSLPFLLFFCLLLSCPSCCELPEEKKD